MCDEIRLVRYDLGETPWGFRITGGRDFGTPLLVVKVIRKKNYFKVQFYY